MNDKSFVSQVIRLSVETRRILSDLNACGSDSAGFLGGIEIVQEDYLEHMNRMLQPYRDDVEEDTEEEP